MNKTFVKLGGVGILVILLLLSFFIPAPTANVKNSVPLVRAYISHDPFRINSDSEMQHMASSEGWSGSGTLFDPYIIEKYEINASRYSYGIYIGNTTLYFTIKNCLIYNANLDSTYSYGILFTNVKYGSIVNNILHSNRYGISIVDSSIIYISDNQVYDNDGGGIEINSDYVSLYDNQIHDNWFYGIEIYEHSHNTITNNTLTNNPMRIYGMSNALYAQDNVFRKNKIYHSGFEFEGGIDTTAYQDIDTSNTVNDKPVYYYKNYTGNGATISPDAGQIILANVTDLSIDNVKITNTSRGIMICQSSSIRITNSNLSYNQYGVYIHGSSGISVKNSNFYHFRSAGVYFRESQSNTIVYNTYTRSGGGGIRGWHSDGNKITNNFCTHVEAGITLYGDNNIISGNNCSHNDYGIGVSGNYNEIYGNNLSFYSSDVIEVAGSHNKVYDNTIYSSPERGMKIFEGSYNKVYNNRIDYTWGDGIYLENEDHTQIYSNQINGSWDNGIYVKGSTWIDIYKNVIENSSDYGIYLTGSKHIRVYNNKFYYNHGSGDTYDAAHIQAYDDANNYWNGTSEGNYWQDWRGPDADNDGIVDEPYAIDGGETKDFYPIAGEQEIPEFNSFALVLIPLITALFLARKRMK